MHYLTAIQRSLQCRLRSKAYGVSSLRAPANPFIVSMAAMGFAAPLSIAPVSHR